MYIVHTHVVPIPFNRQNILLQVLDLSYNNISKIEGLDDLPIQKLLLCGNRITELFGLEKLANLSHLDVSENQIISLSQLTQCSNLTHLNVSKNRIY